MLKACGHREENVRTSEGKYCVRLSTTNYQTSLSIKHVCTKLGLTHIFITNLPQVFAHRFRQISNLFEHNFCTLSTAPITISIN